ncbi:MAG: KpsF/GutQ family sugar-phosphate isomerase [Candidatus Sumerlaeota bacterium]|nr:KpsF/GutQ family sugar-phosphate isomerase [Candidatus Sumerlaeota bacterium]
MPEVDLEYARDVIRNEAATVGAMEKIIAAPFERAAQLIYECKGAIVLTGIGKAGIIAQKISATLASTGTPSHFLHPTEALHGDLGRVREGDVVMILSYGGETEEILRMINHIRNWSVTLIALTGKGQSTLAQRADVTLDMGPVDEVCPLGLAPSASTTAMLAVGDALALTVMKMRDFKAEDYATFHPGGSLGRQLVTVEQSMMFDASQPILTAREDMTVRQALAHLEQQPHDTRLRRPGCVLVVDESRRLRGIITDGDLRRGVAAHGGAYIEMPLSSVMHCDPKHIHVKSLASEAVAMMRRNRIDELPVVDDEHRLVGLIDVQDVLVLEVLK